MSNSIEDILATLKSTSEDAAKYYGPDWDSALVGDNTPEGYYHAVTSEFTGDVVVRAAGDCLQSSWLCDYLAAVQPRDVQLVLKYVRELEQKVATLEGRMVRLPQRMEPEGYHIDEAYLVPDPEGDYFDRDEVIQALIDAGVAHE